MLRRTVQFIPEPPGSGVVGQPESPRNIRCQKYGTPEIGHECWYHRFHCFDFHVIVNRSMLKCRTKGLRLSHERAGQAGPVTRVQELLFQALALCCCLPCVSRCPPTSRTTQETLPKIKRHHDCALPRVPKKEVQHKTKQKLLPHQHLEKPLPTQKRSPPHQQLTSTRV